MTEAIERWGKLMVERGLANGEERGRERKGGREKEREGERNRVGNGKE